MSVLPQSASIYDTLKPLRRTHRTVGAAISPQSLRESARNSDCWDRTSTIKVCKITAKSILQDIMLDKLKNHLCILNCCHYTISNDDLLCIFVCNEMAEAYNAFMSGKPTYLRHAEWTRRGGTLKGDSLFSPKPVCDLRTSRLVDKHSIRQTQHFWQHW